MKKTLLAMAITAVSVTNVHANTLYEGNNTRLTVSGEIDAFLSASELKGSKKKVEDNKSKNYKSDPDIDLWGAIQFDVEHKINHAIKAFGSFEIESGSGFNPGNNDDDDVSLDDLYIGAYINNNFAFAIGEIGDFGDSLDALVIDNTNEGIGYVDDYADRFESEGHAIAFHYYTDNLTLVADTYLSEDEDEDTIYGVSASYNFGKLNVGAAYQDRGNRMTYEETSTGDNSLYGIKLGYKDTNFSINTHYLIEQVDGEDIQVNGVSGEYTVEKMRFYASAFLAENKDSNHSDYDDMTAYTIGSDYLITKNLKGFIEYSMADNYDYEKGAESNVILVGTYFTF